MNQELLIGQCINFEPFATCKICDEIIPLSILAQHDHLVTLFADDCPAIKMVRHVTEKQKCIAVYLFGDPSPDTPYMCKGIHVHPTFSNNCIKCPAYELILNKPR